MPGPLPEEIQTGIDELPGDTGWWHQSDGERIRDAAMTLHQHGLPADVILDVIGDVYYATANEFGS